MRQPRLDKYHNEIPSTKNKVQRLLFCYNNSQYLGVFVRRIRAPLIIFIGIGVILGFFQNCTPAVPFGTTDHFQSLLNSTEFPYEVNIDQVAYMSCNEQEDIFNDGAFFTFRFGSFRTHGIRITPEYRNHIEKVDEEDIPYALQESVASKGLRLQGAIRTMDNLQLMYVDNNNGTEGQPGYDYSNFFPAMGDPILSQSLWYMNSELYLRNYVAARFPDEYRFEGELQFMKSQLMEFDLRNFFGSRGIIAVTFAKEGEITPVGPGSIQYLEGVGDQMVTPSGVNGSGKADVRSAANNNIAANVFGAAIKPSFKQPPKIVVPDDIDDPIIEQDPGADMPSRILSSIQDIIIDERLNNRPLAGWDCPKELSFMIVLPEDAIYQDEDSNTVVRCQMNPDPLNPTAEEKKLFDIARQSIYAEDYYIDLRNRCVVPKPGVVREGSCYGINDNTSMTRPVAYDDYESGCGFGIGQKVCPHYVSVCYRKY